MGVKPTKITDADRSKYQAPDPANTARKLSQSDQSFRDQCAAKGIEPTARQYRKYLSKRNRWA